MLADPAPGELAYVCGPAGLLDAVLARTRHWPNGTIHFERFTPTEEAFAEGSEFEVELAGDGAVLTVPADRSILDVLTEHGYQVLSSCTEGTCGTCETTVLSGAIDHRDAVLSPEEREDGDVMMVCVSRAACPRLVLDL
jgi:ferredoxin